MSLFSIPRCQHLKVNGTQCGSPALKRNRFCFFHKRFQEERIKLNSDRARRGRADLYLPVLEDANSIQVSLMQIMRLLASRQIDAKTASLLLYALQTATLNLRRLTIEPRHIEDVVIDRRTIDQTCIGCDQWSEEDFPDPEETEEEAAAAAAQEAADAAIAARAAARANARHKEALEAEADRLIRQGDPTYVDEPPTPTQPPDRIIPPIGAPRRGTARVETARVETDRVETAQLATARVVTGTLARPLERSSSGSATKPAPVPSIRATQCLHPPASQTQPGVSHKHSAARSQPPASAKPSRKKESRKVDLDKVRKEIQGMTRDWIMKTAKQGGPQGQQA